MKLLFFLQQPATARQQFFAYFLFGIGLLFLWRLYFIAFSPFSFPIDDAYIVIHNAQVLHLGYDPNYVGTPALNGTTSIIHVAFVALLLFWLAPPVALMTVQWLGIFAYVFGLLRLAFLFEASLVQGLFFSVAGLSIGYVSYQLLNGLETGLIFAAMVWTFVATTFSKAHIKRFYVIICCGTLPFFRPELIVFSGLLFICHIWQYLQKSCSIQTKLLLIMQDVLLILLMAAPWLFWYVQDTGTVFSQTALAKYAFFAEGSYPFIQKLYYSVPWLADFILSIGYISFFGMLILLVVTPMGRLGLCFIAIVFTIYLITFPNAFRDYINRYLYIILPFLLYGVVSTLKNSDKILRFGANTLLLIMFCQSLWNFPAHWHTYVEVRQYRQQQASEIVQWCTQHLPANAVVLVNDAGYLAYATSFHLIDLVGLKTPGSVAYHLKFSAPSGGVDRMQAIAAIIAHYHPNYMVVSSTAFSNQAQLSKFGWNLQLLHHSQYDYFVYRISAMQH